MTAPAVETAAPQVSEPVVPVTEAAPVVSAPITPAVTPTPEAPVVTEPLSRKDAKRGLHEDLRTKAEAPAETPVVVAPESQPTDAVIPEAPVVPVAAPAAPAFTIVPIPEGHPLREMGMTEFVARSAQEERGARAAINSYVRRNQVSTLEAQVHQFQQEKVEREARDAAMQKWTGRPEYAAIMEKANEIRDAFGEDVANQFLRGQNADFEKVAQQEYAERMGAVESERVQQMAQAWKQEAWQNVSTLPAAIRELPSYSQEFEKAVQSFDSELALGHFPDIKPGDGDAMHRAFMQFFSSRLTTLPEVVQVYRSLGERDVQARTAAAAKAAEEQRRIDKIRTDAVEEFKRQSAATRTQTPTNPLANLGAVSRDRLPAGSEAAIPAAEDLSPNQLRKALRNGAREDMRRRLGG